MNLTWHEIEIWREERGMRKADLARAAGIPESTIYRGLSKSSRLQPSMRTVMRGIFPEKFNDKGEVRQ